MVGDLQKLLYSGVPYAALVLTATPEGVNHEIYLHQGPEYTNPDLPSVEEMGLVLLGMHFWAMQQDDDDIAAYVPEPIAERLMADLDERDEKAVEDGQEPANTNHNLTLTSRTMGNA